MPNAKGIRLRKTSVGQARNTDIEGNA
jgi:hypothetical protein